MRARFIRKSTALYLLQENFDLSNDRLLRVRVVQPSHIFSKREVSLPNDNYVKCGNLCIFERADVEGKHMVGRLVKFAYLRGSKRGRKALKI